MKISDTTKSFIEGFALAAVICIAAYLNFGHADFVKAKFDKDFLLTECREIRFGSRATWCQEQEMAAKIKMGKPMQIPEAKP